MSKFLFYTDATEFGQPNGLIFCGPGDIASKQSIFSAYGVGLYAPNEYFGENWDAFNDCLMDLQWIDEMNICIVHRELPKLSEKDTSIYLDVLSKATAAWSDDKTAKLHELYPDFVPHRLTIFFPQGMEA